MTDKILACLWFDGDAEEAANFYARTFPNSRVTGVYRAPGDFPSGQTATYLGTVPEAPHRFVLDDHHTFVTGKPMLVCGNTAAMIQQTRFGRHFRVTGDRSVHFGAFPCGPAPSANPAAGAGSACC
jgi:hypothetical protein